jgi:hypothetical protein
MGVKESVVAMEKAAEAAIQQGGIQGAVSSILRMMFSPWTKEKEKSRSFSKENNVPGLATPATIIEDKAEAVTMEELLTNYAGRSEAELRGDPHFHSKVQALAQAYIQNKPLGPYDELEDNSRKSDSFIERSFYTKVSNLLAQESQKQLLAKEGLVWDEKRHKFVEA